VSIGAGLSGSDPNVAAVQFALVTASALLGMGVLVTSLEYLALHRHYGPGGVFSWNVYSLTYRWTAEGGVARTLQRVFSARGFLGLSAVRAACAALLLLVPALGSGERALLLFILVLSGFLLHLRSIYGLDGSDQMTLFVSMGLFAASITSSEHVVSLSCWLITLQTCLAYLVAGVAKLISAQWRSGRGLVGILSTSMYGHGALHAFLQTRPNLTCALSWSVILYECSFFLVLAGSRETTLLILATGVMFHVANAAVMGLNNFLWAFVATYPVVYVTTVRPGM
jgi:hypothetical protein